MLSNSMPVSRFFYLILRTPDAMDVSFLPTVLFNERIVWAAHIVIGNKIAIYSVPRRYDTDFLPSFLAEKSPVKIT